MKIRKVLDKKVRGTSYFRYVLTIPKKVVEEGSFENKEIIVRLEGDRIFIEKQNFKKKKLTKEEKAFRNELLKIVK